jgi:hypothetical protein
LIFTSRGVFGDLYVTLSPFPGLFKGTTLCEMACMSTSSWRCNRSKGDLGAADGVDGGTSFRGSPFGGGGEGGSF